MTHSSGIKCSQELENAFAKARTEGQIRWLRVEIDFKVEPEILNSVKEHKLGDITSDMNDVSNELKPKEPCYILFRKDSKNVVEELGFEWIFISYVPDGSPVKSRMLYASSRDNLKKGLGYSYFTQEIHASEKDEVTVATILGEVKSVKVLSETELQIQHENKLENQERGSSLTSGDNVSVKFPLSGDASNKLNDLASGKINYVQLSLDIPKETIELTDSGSIHDISELPGKVPAKIPSYHLFRWKHTHEGNEHDSILFIYCCPTGSPVKARMLYSTVKSTAVTYAINHKVEPSQKIEITAGEEWNDKLMTDYLHPPEEKKETAFTRPKKPGKGGVKRTNK
eukprot:TRINITY_DN3285_c0_g1_i1.p1 TRINITY_DN3285_c0_g1~~TRINITY_DN3285_c0_g1_i1.p1  ORF type:complete len:341 (+),score=108.72 TRINITY_DN3285_c0_g1_i1:71-1093(+)